LDTNQSELKGEMKEMKDEIKEEIKEQVNIGLKKVLADLLNTEE
jgi:hypothetical protein